jgi:hypothetical protein
MRSREFIVAVLMSDEGKRAIEGAARSRIEHAGGNPCHRMASAKYGNRFPLIQENRDAYMRIDSIFPEVADGTLRARRGGLMV